MISCFSSAISLANSWSSGLACQEGAGTHGQSTRRFSGRDLGFVTLDTEAFGSAKAISIDYAIMEKPARAAVVPVSCGMTPWSHSEPR